MKMEPIANFLSRAELLIIDTSPIELKKLDNGF